jgi:hypothetical protein
MEFDAGSYTFRSVIILRVLLQVVTSAISHDIHNKYAQSFRELQVHCASMVFALSCLRSLMTTEAQNVAS